MTCLLGIGACHLRNADGVFLFLVPGAGYDHERRCHGALGEAEQEADGTDASEVLRGSEARRDRSPQYTTTPR